MSQTPPTGGHPAPPPDPAGEKPDPAGASPDGSADTSPDPAGTSPDPADTSPDPAGTSPGGSAEASAGSFPTPPSTTRPTPSDAPPTESERALARHATAMRRSRTVYFATVALIVVALGVFAGVVWSRGEAAHVTLHTASKAPSSLAVGTPAASVALAWRTADRVAIGTPQYGGTVVTWSAHTVRGRDARTGRTVWSYTRTDRSVCTAAQIDGTTIAVYAVHGNCDELSAFATGRGQRRWTRTLDEDGVPFNGAASYQWSGSTFMLTSPSAIYALDPGSGLDRFIYTRYGCDIDRAVLGTAGVLISQNCSAAVRCDKLKKCAVGRQLVLRDNANRRCESFTDGVCKGQDENPDLLTWNDVGNSAVPVSADAVVSAFDAGTRRLTQYRATNGRALATVRLTGTPSSAADSVAVDTADVQVVWLDGVTYALTAGQATPRWAVRTASAPTVVAADSGVPDLPTSRLTVPTSTGVALLDGNDGQVSRTIRLTAPADGSRVYPLGNGVLVTASSGVLAYR